jgi:hypothetical protein
MTGHLIIICLLALAAAALAANMLPYHRILQRNLSSQRARQREAADEEQSITASLTCLHEALGSQARQVAAVSSVEDFSTATQH